MPSLQDQHKILLDQARAVAERAKAAGRDLTGAEMRTIRDKVDAAEQLKAKIDEADAGQELFRQVMSLGPAGQHVRPGDDEAPRYLDLSRAGMKTLSTGLARNLVGIEGGKKTLLPAGETWGSIPTIPTDPVSLGQQPQGLLSLLPVTQIPSGPAARYLRQTARVLGASYVPAGGTKPVTQLGLTPMSTELKVYATLSEPQDRFQLEDAEVAASWISSELVYAVLTAVEADVVNGTAPGIVGLLQTSGIRTTPFDTDFLKTTRAAVTAAESLGYATDLVWALSPTDWAAAELTAASTSGTYLFPGPPVDQSARRLWGVPVAIVNGLPADTAALISRPAVTLYTDIQGVRVDVGSPGDTWTKNEVQFRCEGRWDLGVLMPEAISKVATAAGP